MPIRFEGSGPYHLPVAQSATAESNKGNGVTLILKCLVDGKKLEAVNVQLTDGVAAELGSKLLMVAMNPEA